MLKINNQDDCYLYNNVSNYKQSFLSSQFDLALFWKEALLLSNCSYATVLQFQFIAISSMNLADLSDKAAKQQQQKTHTKKKKTSRKNNGGKANRSKEKRQVLPKSAQQAQLIST